MSELDECIEQLNKCLEQLKSRGIYETAESLIPKLSAEAVIMQERFFDLRGKIIKLFAACPLMLGIESILILFNLLESFIDNLIIQASSDSAEKDNGISFSQSDLYTRLVGLRHEIHKFACELAPSVALSNVFCQMQQTLQKPRSGNETLN